MPGLFNNSGPYQGDGILAGLGNYFAGIGGAMNPAIQENQFRQQGANTLDQVMGPGMGALFMGSPQAAGLALQQRNLQASIDALTPQFGRAGATYFSLHPEELSKYAAPQKMGPAEHLESPLNLLGMFGGTPNSQQQGQPSAQPGPSNASVGGGYRGPTNNAGLIEQPALQALVERRLKGDTEVNAELSGGMSGLNVLNKAALQKLLAQTMQERGISGSDLARIDAKFPAYKKAQQDLGDMQARMGTAQTEFGMVWPQFMQAYKDWASRYPQMATQFPTGNAFLQFLDKHSGDPSVAPLQQYVTTLRNIYGRAISTNPRGPTDSDKNHFDAGVNTHWNQGQMEQLGTALGNEMSAAQQSIPIQRNVTDVEYGFGKKLDPATQQQAKDAIAKGADRNKVIHRLKENGIDPAGL